MQRRRLHEGVISNSRIYDVLRSKGHRFANVRISLCTVRRSFILLISVGWGTTRHWQNQMHVVLGKLRGDMAPVSFVDLI